MFESTLAPLLIESGYLEPLDAYIQADVSIQDNYDSWLLNNLREQGKGQIYGLPLGKNVYALYFNKDIFTRLNLPLPRDGITWEEVFELAHMINDHPDKGDTLSFTLMEFMLGASQLDARIVNAESGSVELEESLWHRLADFHHEILDVEIGSEYAWNGYVRFAYNRVAMVAGRYLGGDHNAATPAIHQFIPGNAEWDMVSFPVFADHPETGPAPAYYLLGIAKNSDRKDDLFKMISYLLSDGPQMINSQNSLASARKDTELNSRFGEQDTSLDGKNVRAFFHHPEEGTLDPEYDFNMQTFSIPIYHDGVLFDTNELKLEGYRNRIASMLSIRKMMLNPDADLAASQINENEP